jgi:hypothetical protein
MFDIHQVCDIHDHAYEFTNGEQYSRKNADNPYNARLANLEEIFNYIKEKYKRNDCIFIGNDAIVAKLKSINQIGIKYTPVEKLKSLKFCSIKQNMPIIRKATQIETDSYFKILSKTDDGVDLRKYDEVYYVDCELELYLDLNIQEIEYGCKYFHTKENAEKYLEENRTLFSLQEVINELNFHSKEAAISNLQIIAKNKIKKNA